MASVNEMSTLPRHARSRQYSGMIMATVAAQARPKRLLDLLEQVTVLVLYSWLVLRLWPA